MPATPAALLPRPTEDLAAAFPDLARLRGAVERRDWAAVETFFSELHEPDDRAAAALVVGKSAASLDFLRGIASVPSAPGLARVLFADGLIGRGWAIRTGHRAANVSREQFADFHDCLRRAERLLIDATADDPSDALAWYLRLMTARGLQLGRAEARRRYDRLAEHHPHFYAAQAQLLQQLCPKWSGSWELAHAFARECRTDAPPGGLGAAITAEAYLEHWLELPAGQDRTFLSLPDSVAELRSAAALLVDAPVLGRGYHRPTAHGGFAFLFGELRRPADAKPHFAVLARCPSLGGSSLPWARLSGGALTSYTHWSHWMARQK